MLLKSREVIAINQDPLGVAGDRVWKQGPHEVCCACFAARCEPQSPSDAVMDWMARGGSDGLSQAGQGAMVVETTILGCPFFMQGIRDTR